MADVTGTVYAEDGGARYPLRLPLRALATLQAEFGEDVFQRLNEGKALNFALVVRGIELAVSAGNPGLSPQEVAALTDRIGNVDLFGRLVTAAFPAPAEGAPGNGRKPKAAA
jgi:hypothetical protein